MLASLNAFTVNASVTFDIANHSLFVPATAPQHRIFTEFNTGELTRVEQRNYLMRFHTRQVWKQTRNDTTDWQRAAIALESINLLRQAGDLTIKRVDNPRQFRDSPFQYIVISQDTELNVGNSLLFAGDIEKQLRILTYLLGGDIELEETDEQTHNLSVSNSKIMNAYTALTFGWNDDEKQEDDFSDNDAFNDWFNWVWDWLEG